MSECFHSQTIDTRISLERPPQFKSAIVVQKKFFLEFLLTFIILEKGLIWYFVVPYLIQEHKMISYENNKGEGELCVTKNERMNFVLMFFVDYDRSEVNNNLPTISVVVVKRLIR